MKKNHVIARRAKPDVAIPSDFRHPCGIATACGLAMTCRICVITDNDNGKEKEEDFRLPLTLGENYSALAAMT